jgi:hypothetical protein
VLSHWRTWVFLWIDCLPWTALRRSYRWDSGGQQSGLRRVSNIRTDGSLFTDLLYQFSNTRSSVSLSSVSLSRLSLSLSLSRLSLSFSLSLSSLGPEDGNPRRSSSTDEGIDGSPRGVASDSPVQEREKTTGRQLARPLMVKNSLSEGGGVLGKSGLKAH